MPRTRAGAFLFLAALALPAIAVGVAAREPTFGQAATPDTPGVLDENRAIDYATGPTTDRVEKLSAALAGGQASLARDARTGYLLPVIEALGIARESQLLVFSKTGVQRAYTSPQNPRALYFDDSVVVGYVPGAPLLEIASHDPQQGVIFYTIDQTAASPAIRRRMSCLTCHLTTSTLYVPGLIDRSNSVAPDGTVITQLGTTEVTHETAHVDRWGGWFVTSEGAAPPYQQRAHAGNITFAGEGFISDQVFVDWMRSAPETRGYLSPLSDIVSLLAFDHETHAINLLTRVNWEWRVAASRGRASTDDPSIRPLVDDLAGYLLFAREAPLPIPLTPRAGFADRLAARTPKDRRGRSFGELQLVTRLLRYPCSWMVYSDAFDALAPELKQAVYERMIDLLAHDDRRFEEERVSSADREAILEILRDTKPDFPGHQPSPP